MIDRAAMTDAIVLRNAHWQVRVLPEIGGSLAECTFQGATIFKPVLQETPASREPVELCYFPMLPFANRIMNSRFSFKGRAIELEPNLRDYPHALHGHGWQTEWHLLSSEAMRCTLGFDHAASEHWPWSYTALQTYAIDAGAFAITLALKNLSTDTMPASIGFHPFFPRPDSARLAAMARRLWNGPAADFPSVSIDVPIGRDFAGARPVREARGMDHCYSGWTGHAAIEWPDAPYGIVLAADECLQHFFLYVPEDRDFFCIEPVSHAINAFNFPGSEESAALALAPGAELAGTMRVRAVARSATTSSQDER